MNFIKQFVALVQGDDAEALALKTQRKAHAAVNAQVSSLNGDTIEKEEVVTEAKERLQSALVNGGSDTFDRTDYVSALLKARNSVVIAEKQLSDHLAKLAFLEGTLTSIKDSEPVSV